MTAISVILNPAAGRGEQVVAVRQWVERHIHITLDQTQRRGDGVELARRAAERGADTVVAAGGDGTVHEVVNGLMQAARRPRLAIFPLGTGNDFVRSTGLGNDFPRALELIESADAGEYRPIDLIRATADKRDIWFINVATGGFSATVRQAMTRRLKRYLGPFAYACVACKCFWHLPHYRVEVDTGDERHRVLTPSICLANGRFVAGGVEIAPQAAVDDHRMDLALFRPHNLQNRLSLLGSYLLARGHLRSRHTTYRQVTAATVEASPPMRFIADGEDIGETPMTFTLVPAAVELLVPRRRAGG